MTAPDLFPPDQVRGPEREPYWPNALTWRVAVAICCGARGCQKDSPFRPEHQRGICGALTWRDRAALAVAIVKAANPNAVTDHEQG
jgi:hypothetical protein